MLPFFSVLFDCSSYACSFPPSVDPRPLSLHNKSVIEFQTPEAAMTAIETLNNSLIEVDGQERQIVVLPDRSERVAFPVFEPEFEGRVLFVKNIPSNHPESKDALLAAAPNATAVNPVTNRSFVVVFETVGEAQDAISKISPLPLPLPLLWLISSLLP